MSTCLDCRQVFSSNNKLHEHIRTTCWATIHEAKYPKEWTPGFRNYVQRALDPVNSEPGWNIPNIIQDLKSMIEVDSTVFNRMDGWDRRDLPQHIDPHTLAYVRPPKLKRLRDASSTSPPPAARLKRLRVATSPSPPPDTKQYPSIFETPYFAPREIFRHENEKLFVAHRDYRELMIYTDGACYSSGMRAGRAGCAFVFRHIAGNTDPVHWEPPEGSYIMNGAYFFRLEDRGVTGSSEIPTNNRAELRAVVAALTYLRKEEVQSEDLCSGLEFWQPKESAKLVIVTCSSYVVSGATKWSREWEANGWKNIKGEQVRNQDLWELLLERIRILQSTRCTSISFWLVPRSQNVSADQAAKYAATLPARPRFGVPGGLPVVVDTTQVAR